jgi:hypothetical protein
MPGSPSPDPVGPGNENRHQHTLAAATEVTPGLGSSAAPERAQVGVRALPGAQARISNLATMQQEHL